MTTVPDTIVEDRRATRDELLAHREALLSQAAARGLGNVRLRNDAAPVLTTSNPGYRDVASFVNTASQLVGAYVYAVTDDTPGLEAAAVPLSPPPTSWPACDGLSRRSFSSCPNPAPHGIGTACCNWRS
jgi:hypothetical protein